MRLSFPGFFYVLGLLSFNHFQVLTDVQTGAVLTKDGDIGASITGTSDGVTLEYHLEDDHGGKYSIEKYVPSDSARLIYKGTTPPTDGTSDVLTIKVGYFFIFSSTVQVYRGSLQKTRQFETCFKYCARTGHIMGEVK